MESVREEKTSRNSRKYLRKKKNKRFIWWIGILVISIFLMFLFQYLGIFPFNSSILAYDRVNILIVGCDEIENISRADTIVFLSIAPKTRDALAVSIPRDTRVEIPGRGMDKVNHAYAFGGIDLLKKTVSSFLDVPLHFYVIADFRGFVQVINTLGGVEVEVEKEMHYTDKAGGLTINLYPGKQLLDGEKALEYVRFRMDKLGDWGRIQRQQKLAIALINKMMKYENFNKIPKLLEEVKGSLETDIEMKDVMALINLFKGVEQEKIKFEIIQAKPVYIEGISYLEPEVKEVRERIKGLLDHQD